MLRSGIYLCIHSIEVSTYSVPVGDSKETKTSSFPLTSVPSLDIKTLGGSSPILAKDKN